MRTTIVLCCIVYVFLFLLPASSDAAIVVIPNAPLSTQNVHIQDVNQYRSAASITSATITRNGNQFIIAQAVDLACLLPSAPILTSDFDVGILPPGTYQVMAQIQHTSVLPGCGGYTLSQNASFTVSGPIAVPAGSPFGYFIVACLLAFFGARRLMASNGCKA
jgi:archaellum component FlaF (FlaF/FlaG flagellin family)